MKNSGIKIIRNKIENIYLYFKKEKECLIILLKIHKYKEESNRTTTNEKYSIRNKET